jgi:hypothetical protein
MHVHVVKLYGGEWFWRIVQSIKLDSRKDVYPGIWQFYPRKNANIFME